MAQSLNKTLIHIVFSTKNRTPVLAKPVQLGLYPYMVGIAETIRCKILSVGGIDDHVHILISLAKTISVADMVQEIKRGSSRWITRSIPELSDFSWQAGYGTFSIGQSQVATVAKYIESQKKHHQKMTFQEEYIAFLKKYGIDYDEKYLWQ